MDPRTVSAGSSTPNSSFSERPLPPLPTSDTDSVASETPGDSSAESRQRHQESNIESTTAANSSPSSEVTHQNPGDGDGSPAGLPAGLERLSLGVPRTPPYESPISEPVLQPMDGDISTVDSVSAEGSSLTGVESQARASARPARPHHNHSSVRSSNHASRPAHNILRSEDSSGSESAGGLAIGESTATRTRSRHQSLEGAQNMDRAHFVVPKWQPDATVTLCPICRTQFSFFVRKHHCSHQHQKFLLLPELDPGLILDALEVLQWWRTLVEESECDFAIHAYLIQILLLHRFLNRGTASLDQPSKVTAALPRDIVNSYATNTSSYSERNTRLRPEDLQSRSRSSTVGTHRDTSNMSNPASAISQWTGPEQGRSEPPQTPSSRPRPTPRPVIREEDECWICHKELPSRNFENWENVRAEHVNNCLALAMQGPSVSTSPAPSPAPITIPSQSPRTTPPSQAESSRAARATPTIAPPIANTPEARMAARERAHAAVVLASSSTSPVRRTGVFPYKATEKDCIDDAECTICLEEFEVGEDMGRLECFCRFHLKCIREWFVNRPGQCPVHQHGAGY
ncbi:hypothetical protein IFR04_006725 [Cadophora malorum]|uniref:RING-type E3 ubiquitin transferase n=1 Tax=Cadophora malorum TaxID=108018 RepID=A0A8H7W989_9HELO|nr:hypothetical protein IFR04_006725 [Cadophora malorum]